MFLLATVSPKRNQGNRWFPWSKSNPRLGDTLHMDVHAKREGTSNNAGLVERRTVVDAGVADWRKRRLGIEHVLDVAKALERIVELVACVQVYIRERTMVVYAGRQWSVQVARSATDIGFSLLQAASPRHHGGHRQRVDLERI